MGQTLVDVISRELSRAMKKGKKKVRRLVGAERKARPLSPSAQKRLLIERMKNDPIHRARERQAQRVREALRPFEREYEAGHITKRQLDAIKQDMWSRQKKIK